MNQVANTQARVAPEGNPDGEDALADSIEEHAEEAGLLWLQRTHAVRAPNYSPQQFGDLAERLAAHLDGLRVAGTQGWQRAQENLENQVAENFFTAGVLALQVQHDHFDVLIEQSQQAAEVVPGLISALGWVSPKHLAGRAKAWMGHASAFRQRLGLAACALHRVNIGATLPELMNSSRDGVRSRAFRACGEMGRIDVLPQLLAGMNETSPEPRFWRYWSAALLGGGERALNGLRSLSLQVGLRQMDAMRLYLMSTTPQVGHELLQQMDDLPDALRLRILGTGFLGSAKYVPWLIEQMERPATARIAGEAFVHICGADFNLDQLEALPPDEVEDGPTDDPEDEDVELPQDVALPWPDVDRIKAWWSEHKAQLPADQKLFMGHSPTDEHCANVLRSGYQSQRVIAALYRSLLQPGTVLFPTSAPSWRQQKLLEAAASDGGS